MSGPALSKVDGKSLPSTVCLYRSCIFTTGTSNNIFSRTILIGRYLIVIVVIPLSSSRQLNHSSRRFVFFFKYTIFWNDRTFLKTLRTDKTNKVDVNLVKLRRCLQKVDRPMKLHPSSHINLINFKITRGINVKLISFTLISKILVNLSTWASIKMILEEWQDKQQKEKRMQRKKFK